MFDSMFDHVGDDALVGVIEQLAREEAKVAARRLAAIAELVHRTVDEDDERARWAFDPWSHTAARVAAALGVGQRRASGQMRIAVALRDRLPAVAALFSQGVLSARLISEITWRTQLVDDDELIAVIDTELADKAVRWGTLSESQLDRAIDAVIDRFDPDGVRRAKDAVRTRDFHIGACEDTNEITVVWGRLTPTDAAALRQRITAMVAGLCADDPRSAGERWADAVGALGHGNTVLACRCGAAQCPSADVAPASTAAIRVIADQAAVDAARALIAAEDAELAKANAAKAKAAKPEPTPPQDAEPPHDAQPPHDAEPPQDSGPPQDSATPPRLSDSGVAVLPGRGVIPTPVLAEAIRGGAKVNPLWLPGPDPEPQYRPSARLAEFIRVRDMFCRFPGCDVPADRCDIDHVNPWPSGPTHPSNLNCKCRTHHLMKTFWGGPDGWRDTQYPDATVIWTAPDGRTYTTRPGSTLFFPACNLITADLPPPTSDPPDPAATRSMMMPRRRRTRAADNATRIKTERAQNNPLTQSSPR